MFVELNSVEKLFVSSFQDFAVEFIKFKLQMFVELNAVGKLCLFRVFKALR